jgi:hypothetical protein
MESTHTYIQAKVYKPNALSCFVTFFNFKSRLHVFPVASGYSFFPEFDNQSLSTSTQSTHPPSLVFHFLHIVSSSPRIVQTMARRKTKPSDFLLNMTINKQLHLRYLLTSKKNLSYWWLDLPSYRF